MIHKQGNALPWLHVRKENKKFEGIEGSSPAPETAAEHPLAFGALCPGRKISRSLLENIHGTPIEEWL